MNRLFFIFIFFTISCNKLTVDCPVSHIKLSLSKTPAKYALKMKDDNYQFTSIKYLNYADGNYKLAIGYKQERKLLIVNLSEENGQIEKEILLPKEGQGSVPPIDDFIYISADSILLISSDSYEISLIDTAANLKQKWSLISESKAPFEVGDFIPDVKPPAHTFEYSKSLKKVYFNTSHNLVEPYGPKYYDFPFIGEYDLEKEQLTDFYGEYAPFYSQSNETVFEWQFPFLLQGEDLVVSYPTLQNIWSSKNGDICRHSHSFNDVNTLKFSASLQERNQNWRLSGRYIYMRYNPYRKEFISVVKHPAPENADPIKFQFLESEWSIIVLNESLIPKYEIYFPSHQYNFNWVIPTPNGVLISTDSDFNPEDKEEYIEFNEINFEEI